MRDRMREIRILIMNARWTLIGMHHKVVESDHFEIGILDEFPCSRQFERIAVPQPVLETSAARLSLKIPNLTSLVTA